LISNAIKFTERGSVRITFRWIRGNYRIGSDVSLECSPNDLDCYKLQGSFTEIGQADLFRLPKAELKKNNMGELHDFLCFKLGESVKLKLEENLLNYSETKDNFLRIDISDTGCGISQEAQSKLFEPFIQAEANVSSIYGGTGLGLYIVKKIVEKMSGIIKLNSMRDIGTRFQIMLPIKQERERGSIDSLMR